MNFIELLGFPGLLRLNIPTVGQWDRWETEKAKGMFS
jgi:hypothetical protein